MTDRMEKIARGIASFLAYRVANYQGLGARTFYGESYALLLLFQTGLLEPKLKSALLGEYGKKDKKHPEFHWEFNNYALFKYRLASGDAEIDPYLFPLRFRGIGVTNWTLLRDAVKTGEGSQAERGIAEAKDTLERNQLKNGLILDQRPVRSFQYHCFSMALLGEIARTTRLPFFQERFRAALDFIRPFILSNGDTTYIGRGQEQSFGYGALLYGLAQGYEQTGDRGLLSDIDRVLGFLESFQREDGSFPLVLNGFEQGVPKQTDPQDVRYSGWYPYNNFFDYLPFLGSFLWQAKELLEKTSLSDRIAAESKPYLDGFFQKVVTSRYEAVIAKGGGYWTNGLPMPYIVSRKGSLTPCYGGEQFQKSIYDLSGIPVPQWGPGRCSFLKWGFQRFSEKKMIFYSPGGIVHRNFEFLDSKITVETRVSSPFHVRHLYLFPVHCEQRWDGALRGPGLTVSSDQPLFPLGVRYSASGPLNLFGVEGNRSVLTYEVDP